MKGDTGSYTRYNTAINVYGGRMSFVNNKEKIGFYTRVTLSKHLCIDIYHWFIQNKGEKKIYLFSKLFNFGFLSLQVLTQLGVYFLKG